MGTTSTPPVDRRQPRQQRQVVGGSRQSDPPLTTRACADWMGLTPEWIRSAIDEGVKIGGGDRNVILEGASHGSRERK